MNGFKNVRFAFRHINSPVAYCALSVRTGTRDENPAYNGLAHLTEHMLFKGTERRGAASINNVLERVGGELNAYTTKEEIVLHATVLREDLSKAVDLLAELAFTSVFPDRELEKELDVVYDEIVSYEDSPADAIYDHFEELLFEGHPLSLLGTKENAEENFFPHAPGISVLLFCPGENGFYGSCRNGREKSGGDGGKKPEKIL